MGRCALKITFVYPDLLFHRPDWHGYYYSGIGFLSSVLMQGGHKTSLIHITKSISQSDFIKRVKKEDPDLIGFSSTSPMFPFVKRYASWLRDAGIFIPTICGGIHPTIAPEESITPEGIDMICRGEGEAPLTELCNKMVSNEEFVDTPNLWFKRNGEIIRNPLRPIMEDLDSLPFPDRSIFDYQKLYSERENRGAFIVSRGCPYSCTYCSNQLLREIYGSEGKPVRFRSVDNVIAEIKEVLKNYPFIKSLIFDDDILFLNRSWAEEFAEKYPREINFPFICNHRANLANRERVGLLKKAGCYHVKFGLESGNEWISNKVLNRHLSKKQIKRAFARCKEAGLGTESFNMVGIPFETPSMILDTIKLNAAVSVDKMQVSIFQPYHGTKLANVCREMNFLIPKDLKPDWCSPSINIRTTSTFQVLMFRDYFKPLVLYYQILQKLPAEISKICIKNSDQILSSKFTARALNALYMPLNYLYRQMLIFRIKVRGRADGKPKRLTPLPSFAWVAVSNRCNLRCAHCMRRLLKKQGLIDPGDMSWDLFRKLELEVLPHLERIQFGGNNFGEQMMASNWDLLFERVAKLNIKISVVTNATFLTQERVRAMVDAGVEFNLSLEGATEESYEKVRGHKYKKFLRTVETTCQAKKEKAGSGTKVNLGFTVFRDNIEELPALLKTAAQIEVDRVTVNHFAPWKESQRYQSLVYHKDLANRVFAKAENLARDLGLLLDIPRPFDLQNGSRERSPLGVESTMPSTICYHPWKSVSINERGDVMPCCATSVIMGNLAKSSFSEIWNGTKYQRLRRTVNSSHPPTFCRNCAIRGMVLGTDRPLSFCNDEKILLGAIGSERNTNYSSLMPRRLKYRLQQTKTGRKLLPHIMEFYRMHGALIITGLGEGALMTLIDRLLSGGRTRNVSKTKGTGRGMQIRKHKG
ncbi:MAG: radical SAM protein [Promethearchaeota archaeon]|jgi:radical SAM protein with 4Fe4S-binding SPASM domain